MAGARAKSNRLDGSGHLAAMRAIMEGGRATMQGSIAAGQGIAQGLHSIGGDIQRGKAREQAAGERQKDRQVTMDLAAQRQQADAARLQFSREQFKFRQSNAEREMIQHDLDQVDRQIGMLNLQGQAAEASGGQVDAQSKDRLETLLSRRGVLEQSFSATRTRMQQLAGQSPAAAAPGTEAPSYAPLQGVPGATPENASEPTIMANQADPRVALLQARKAEAMLDGALRLANTDAEYVEALGQIETLRQRTIGPLEIRVAEMKQQDEAQAAAKVAQDRVQAAADKADQTIRKSLKKGEVTAARSAQTAQTNRLRVRKQDRLDKEAADAEEKAEADPLASEKRAASKVADHYRRLANQTGRDDEPVPFNWDSFGTQELESALRSGEGFLGPAVVKEIHRELLDRNSGSGGIDPESFIGKSIERGKAAGAGEKSAAILEAEKATGKKWEDWTEEQRSRFTASQAR